MELNKAQMLKGLGLSAAIGLMIGGGISLLYEDLEFFCKYGLISYVPNCTNHVVYPLLIVFTAVIVYVMILLLYLMAKVWKKSS